MKVRMKFRWKVDDHAVYVRRDPDPTDSLDERYILKIPMEDYEKYLKDDNDLFIDVTIEPETDHPAEEDVSDDDPV